MRILAVATQNPLQENSLPERLPLSRLQQQQQKDTCFFARTILKRNIKKLTQDKNKEQELGCEKTAMKEDEIISDDLDFTRSKFSAVIHAAVNIISACPGLLVKAQVFAIFSGDSQVCPVPQHSTCAHSKFLVQEDSHEPYHELSFNK